ncbi:MAG: hypothetical protein DCF32_00230 [Leptolyngbya sp.]|jgi:hypothetical protein|nr:MAG: hypothetical protein DCF32_00230 [Leptolyngbya sp.]
MQTDELIDLFDIPFAFRGQPTPLQPQLRIIWGLSILVLILSICSRSNRSSIPRLHVLNWALRSSQNRERLISLLEDNSSPLGILVRYEPGFNRAIEYAIAESIVEPMGSSQNLRIQLLEKGKQFAQEISDLSDCLEEEKIFLRERGAAVNETFVKNLLRHR